LKKQIEYSGQTIHLLYSANRWEVMNKLKKLLDEENIVVCDRYWYFAVVFTLAKNNKEISKEWAIACTLL